jgi:hypothetical protein
MEAFLYLIGGVLLIVMIVFYFQMVSNISKIKDILKDMRYDQNADREKRENNDDEKK